MRAAALALAIVSSGCASAQPRDPQTAPRSSHRAFDRSVFHRFPFGPHSPGEPEYVWKGPPVPSKSSAPTTYAPASYSPPFDSAKFVHDALAGRYGEPLPASLPLSLGGENLEIAETAFAKRWDAALEAAGSALDTTESDTFLVVRSARVRWLASLDDSSNVPPPETRFELERAYDEARDLWLATGVRAAEAALHGDAIDTAVERLVRRFSASIAGDIVAVKLAPEDVAPIVAARVTPMVAAYRRQLAERAASVACEARVSRVTVLLARPKP